MINSRFEDCQENWWRWFRWNLRGAAWKGRLRGGRQSKRSFEVFRQWNSSISGLSRNCSCDGHFSEVATIQRFFTNTFNHLGKKFYNHCREVAITIICTLLIDHREPFFPGRSCGTSQTGASFGSVDSQRNARYKIYYMVQSKISKCYFKFFQVKSTLSNSLMPVELVTKSILS